MRLLVKLRRAADSMRYSPAVGRTDMPMAWLSSAGNVPRQVKPYLAAEAISITATCNAASNRCREKRTCTEKAALLKHFVHNKAFRCVAVHNSYC
jgi:hypothetical protein